MFFPFSWQNLPAVVVTVCLLPCVSCVCVLRSVWPMVRWWGIAWGDDGGEKPRVYGRRCNDLLCVVGNLSITGCSFFICCCIFYLRCSGFVFGVDVFFLMVLVSSGKFSVLMFLLPVFHLVRSALGKAFLIPFFSGCGGIGTCP